MTDWEKAYRELQEKVQRDPSHRHYWVVQSGQFDSLGREYLVCYCGKRRLAIWGHKDS